MRQVKFAGMVLIVPALIFWAVSIKFFIMGLSVDDRSGEMFNIAIALSVANTIIQIMGNSYSREELGWVLFVGWIASYVLGVLSNVYALSLIMNIPIPIVEWGICLSLGAMIEFMPEKFFVIFWREVFPNGLFGFFATRHHDHPKKSKVQAQSQRQNNQENHPEGSVMSQVPPRPSGMPRDEYRRMLKEKYGIESISGAKSQSTQPNRVKEN